MPRSRTPVFPTWQSTQQPTSACPPCRPFDSAKVTKDSGSFYWLGNPQSILMNGKGYYGDCALGPYGSSDPPTCDVSSQWVAGSRSPQQPEASETNPGGWGLGRARELRERQPASAS